MIRVHAELVTGEDSLPSLQTATFSLLTHIAEGERETETKFSGVCVCVPFFWLPHGISCSWAWDQI